MSKHNGGNGKRHGFLLSLDIALLLLTCLVKSTMMLQHIYIAYKIKCSFGYCIMYNQSILYKTHTMNMLLKLLLKQFIYCSKLLLVFYTFLVLCLDEISLGTNTIGTTAHMGAH